MHSFTYWSCKCLYLTHKYSKKKIEKKRSLQLQLKTPKMKPIHNVFL